MEPREVVLRALELLDRSLTAESSEAAIVAVRADLEVLTREDLLRVATALAVETPRRWVGSSYRGKLVQRVEHARLEIAWAGS